MADGHHVAKKIFGHFLIWAKFCTETQKITLVMIIWKNGKIVNFSNSKLYRRNSEID